MTDHLDTEISSLRKPIVEHLRELRRRLMMSVLCFIVAVVVCYHFADVIYQFLLRPLSEAEQQNFPRRLIFTGLTEAFFTYIKLALFAGFIVSFPVIAWQGYSFLAPGLYKKERRVLVPFLVLSPVLFLLGAAMAYYAIFPLAWQFFLGFESVGGEGQLPIQLEARISEYLSLTTHIIIAFGVAFQLPVILMLLARAGVVTGDSLRRYRKYALLGAFVIAAIITPPDVISQIGLALPLLLLYELAIIGCRFTRPKEQTETTSEDATHA